MSNEKLVPWAPRVIPTMYSRLAYEDALKRAFPGRNAKMADNSNRSKSSTPDAVTMPIEIGNAAAPKSYNTPIPSNRPTLPSENSSTASSFNTIGGIQGSSKCPSEPSKSGNSTDSSDQPLAASRSQRAQTSEPLPANNKKKDKGKQRAMDSRPQSAQTSDSSEPLPANNKKKDKGKQRATDSPPKHSAEATAQSPAQSPHSDQPPKKPDPRAGYVFVRGRVATCGCLYLIEVGPNGFATLRDQKKAGFPRHGHHCAKCKYITAEIRIDDKGNAVVTEIEARPPSPDRENDVSSDEDPEDYDDEYDEEELMDMYETDMHQEEEGSSSGGGGQHDHEF